MAAAHLTSLHTVGPWTNVETISKCSNGMNEARFLTLEGDVGHRAVPVGLSVDESHSMQRRERRSNNSSPEATCMASAIAQLRVVDDSILGRLTIETHCEIGCCLKRPRLEKGNRKFVE